MKAVKQFDYFGADGGASVRIQEVSEVKDTPESHAMSAYT